MDATSDRWRQIYDIFNRALEVPAGEREAFLHTACSTDPTLHQEVVELLETYEREPEFLEDAVVRVPELLGDEADPLVDSRVGSYRLQRRIGAGGMGVVYLAVREDDYRMEVALKVVKRGLDSEEIVRRFRAERQILASLVHPHIASLLDGGITDDGRPYFVMEYLGECLPLDTHCDRFRLPIAQRLNLFQQVCGAVHFAHQNLIVHRDLKPSNILVSQGGEVKLMDFGIAKLLDPDGSGVTVAATRAGMRLLTPDYASPEQLRGEQITTASDIYALGVLLYELLTGLRPYQLPGRSYQEISSAVCDQEPLRPSQAVQRQPATIDGAPTATPETIASARGIGSDRLYRHLRGDLDNIVLMAMRKEPERRYASAEALSDDLQSYLDGKPVMARPHTMGYRLDKFVRRNLIAVAAGVLVTASLVAGLAGTAWQARLALEARDEARLEAQNARQVADFMTSVFQLADPTFSRGDEITARELLDQGASRLETELAGQPDLAAKMMQTMGEVYMNLALYEQAEDLLGRSLELRRTTLGGEHREVAASLGALGTLAHRKGDLQRAETTLVQSLELRRRLLARDHPEIALTLDRLAQVRAAQGQFQIAEELHREALEGLEAARGAEDGDVARVMNNLAQTLQRQDSFNEAEALMRRALETRRSLYGSKHTAIVDSNRTLASLLRQSDRYQEAEPLLNENLQLTRELYGEDHPAMAAAWSDLAGLLVNQGGYQEAASAYQHAIEIARASLGAGHPNTLAYRNKMAATYLYRGDYSTAIKLYREVIPMTEASLGSEHPFVAEMRSGLSYALSYLGELAAAERELRRVLQIEQSIYGDEHTQVAMTLASLSTLLWDLDRRPEAVSTAREALQMRRGLLPPDHTAIANSLYSLGVQLHYQGAPESGELLGEALQIYRKRFPADHPMIAYALLALGEDHIRYLRFDEADSAGREALALLESRKTRDDYGIWRSKNLLGAVLVERGQTAPAEPWLLDSFNYLCRSDSARREVKDLARQRLVALNRTNGQANPAAVRCPAE